MYFYDPALCTIQTERLSKSVGMIYSYLQPTATVSVILANTVAVYVNYYVSVLKSNTTRHLLARRIVT